MCSLLRRLTSLFAVANKAALSIRIFIMSWDTLGLSRSWSTALTTAAIPAMILVCTFCIFTSYDLEFGVIFSHISLFTVTLVRASQFNSWRRIFFQFFCEFILQNSILDHLVNNIGQISFDFRACFERADFFCQSQIKLNLFGVNCSGMLTVSWLRDCANTDDSSNEYSPPLAPGPGAVSPEISEISWSLRCFAGVSAGEKVSKLCWFS